MPPEHHVVEFHGRWWAELTHGSHIWMAGSTEQDLIEVVNGKSPLVNGEQMATVGNVPNLKALFQFLKENKEARKEFARLIHKVA